MKKPTRFRRIRPSFQSSGRYTRKKSAMVESAFGNFGSRREEMEIDCRNGGKRRRTEQKVTEIEEGDDGERGEEENREKEEVERRIEALQRMVPGGDLVGVDKLFEKTAAYILCLQRQLKALTTLSSIFERLDKEKTKCGG